MDTLSQDKRKKHEYYHIISGEFTSLPKEINKSFCDKIDYNQINYEPRWHPKAFFEGTIKDGDRDVLYFLQKTIPDKQTLLDVIEILTSVTLGHICYLMSKDKDRLGSDRFEDYQRASSLFKEFGIPEELLEKGDCLASNKAMFNKYRKSAEVIVPGYVVNISLSPWGIPVTEVELVPKESKRNIETLIRKIGLEGNISFWNNSWV